ncbi:MAG TPA: hypothetical protein VLA88_01955 [Candidatus Saccharimonadales bacterium]|nr:hypothetical protein [Candidatus Saccharimonadales bacterium]
MIQELLVVVGASLQIGQVAPFLVAMARGSAKPNIVSWCTWTVLTGIGSAAAFISGDRQAGVIVGANGLGTAAVVVLGFWRGYAKLTRFDVLCQVGALLGFATWPLLQGPLLAVIIVVVIDAVAAVATLYHAYRRPYEEVWLTYTLAGLGALCGLFALNEFTIVSSLYLFYLVVADMLISAVILVRRRMAAL